MVSSTAGGSHSRPIHSLVLDTAPLLTSPYGQIKSFNATNYYTVPLAREEVKDEIARAALEIWGNELRVRQPLAKSIQEGMPAVSIQKADSSHRILKENRRLWGFELGGYPYSCLDV
jgi:hypothetical protein